MGKEGDCYHWWEEKLEGTDWHGRNVHIYKCKKEGCGLLFTSATGRK